MLAASPTDVNAEFVTARRQSPLQGSNDTRRNARGVPVHAHDGTERLKPEGICQASQQFVPTIVMDDGLRHDCTEPSHPVGQPPRNVATVERQIGAPGPSCHYSYVPVGVCRSTKRYVHALYYDWRFGATWEMSCADRLLRRDARALRSVGSCLRPLHTSASSTPNSSVLLNMAAPRLMKHRRFSSSLAQA